MSTIQNLQHTGRASGKETSGVQPWSAGPIYPWTIVIQGRATIKGATAFIYALNGSTGEKTTRYPYTVGNKAEYNRAHRYATQDAELILKADAVAAA